MIQTVAVSTSSFSLTAAHYSGLLLQRVIVLGVLCYKSHQVLPEAQYVKDRRGVRGACGGNVFPKVLRRWFDR